MDDEQIIALYFARSEEAIRQTDAVYGRKLHSLSDRILRSREDAQECVNDTYLNTWNAIPPRHPTHFFAFLAAACRNLSLIRLDCLKARTIHAEVLCLSEEMELCIPDTRREQELENQELGRMLTAFLEGLPRESRLIFLRRYWYGESLGEIAAADHSTENRIAGILFRTRKKLKAHLEKEGYKV